ncbi:major tail protein [Lachnospiraceae bacterium OF09-33XD]|nr:major tail protein [Lachnospiraceae bacterium OF09-33XD]
MRNGLYGIDKANSCTAIESGKGNIAYTGGFRLGQAIKMEIRPVYEDISVYQGMNDKGYDQEIAYADVNLDVSALPAETNKLMFGHIVGAGENTVSYRCNDTGAYVGFGAICREKVNGTLKYIAFWLYKVKFMEKSQSHETGGDSIEYDTPSLEGRALPVNGYDWMVKCIHGTEEEAIAWLNTMAGISKNK